MTNQRPAPPADLTLRLARPVVAVLLALAVLKGLRMPNRWAVTHYLFDYQTGFLKRGLWGQLLRIVLGHWTTKYFCLAAVGLVILAGIVVLVVRLTRRVTDASEWLPLTLALFSSPAVSFAAHMVGYLEQIAYLALMLIAIQRRRWWLQVASAMVAACVLPLVHEASVFWVGGLLGLVLVAGPIGRHRALRVRAGALALVSVAWLASTLAVSEYGQVTRERADVIRDADTEAFDIRPRQDAFATLAIPLDASLADMRRRWNERETREDMAFSLVTFAPGAIFLGWLAIRRTMAREANRGARVLAVVLIASAIAGPLVLHVVGWDRHRWNALAALNAGIAALVVCAGGRAGPTDTTPDPEPPRPSRRLATLAFAVCVWNISADPVFFDAYGPAHPPFTYQVQFLMEAVETRDPNLWIPRPGN